MEYKYNLGIVGAGPAGYTAALHAAKKGLSVVMFEKDCIGGICLNRGCIPTKSILHCAEFYKELKCAQSLGIVIPDFTYDFAKVVERKNQIVQKLRKSLELAVKNSKITMIKAKADVINTNTISTTDDCYRCDKIIIASGSQSVALPGIEFDHKRILNSDDVLDLQYLPESIAIIGSGAIGIEWARIFSAFDVDVTVIEMAENLLPVADIEVSKRIERIFKANGIKFYKSTKVEDIQCNEKCLLRYSSGNVTEVDKVLVAIGRKPVPYRKIDGVTYLGDICGEIQLAHYAIKQAIAEIDGIHFDKSLVRSVVYGNPEIAWIGKREQDLEKGSYKKSMLLISALGKSQCDNAVDGFIKILSQDGIIVGAHIVSKEASSLIQQVSIAMQNNVTVEKLKEVCFAHPTYSEGIFESLFNLE